MGRPTPTHVDSAGGVAKRLRDARLRARLTQQQLSFDGCSTAYISRIESGDRVPSLQLIRELAARLGVTEEYLARGAEAVTPNVSERVEAELLLALDETAEAEQLFQRALEEALTPDERAEALEGLGKVALRAGRAVEAVEYLTRALRSAGGDPAANPRLAELLARAHATIGEAAPAIALLEACVERFEREGDPVQLVRFAALLGYAFTDNGNFAEAERTVAKALAAGRSVADPYSRARLYWSQSRLRTEQGQSELAERYAWRALETLRATEDSYHVAIAMEGLAHIILDLGRPEEALALLEEGWPLISAAGTPADIAHYRIEEVRALAAIGETERAASLAMELSAKLEGLPPSDSGRVYVELAAAFADLGDAARALELYELGIDYLEQVPPNRYLIAAYRRMSELLEQQGRSDDALALLKRAVGAQETAGRLLA
jgi:tetratricopeptide (TPR) repeat protein